MQMQTCLRLCREKNWEKALEIAEKQIEFCVTKGLKNHHARTLIQISNIHLESNPKQFMSALPPLLEALFMTESSGMLGLHAAALSFLAKIFLRLQKPKRSLAILRAAIPTLLQREHVWFQAEAFLTEAKSYLQLSSSSASPTNNRAALASLEKSHRLFGECQDFQRLREVLYLQARIYSRLNDVSRRDAISKKFVQVDGHLQTQQKSRRSNILSSLNDPLQLSSLVQRSM